MAAGPGRKAKVDTSGRLPAFQQFGNRNVPVIFAFTQQVFPRIVRDLYVKVDLFVFAPAVFLEFRQRDELAAEGFPLVFYEGILAVHESIHHPHIGRPLSRIVLNVKKLETTEAGGAEAHLDIGLIQFRRPSHGGPVEILRLVREARGLQPATEFHQVVRHEGRPFILVDFGVIRIALELTRLMADDRDGDAFERPGIVPRRPRIEMVQDAAVLRVAKGKGAPDVRSVFPVGFPTGSGGRHEVHPLQVTLVPQESVGAIRIEDLRGLLPERVHEGLHHCRLAPQFVAQGKHRERGVVPIGFQDVDPFLSEEGQQLFSLERSPEGKLWLKVDSELIRSREGGLRRAPGMEPDVVDPVILTTLEIFDPGGFIHGRVSSGREHAGVVLAAEEDLTATGLEMAVLHLESRHRHRRPGGISQIIGGTEFDPADHAVPVRLRILRIQV